MARLLSTSTAIPAPKTANTFIPIETPQISVLESTFLSQTYRPDALEDATLEKFNELRAAPIPLVGS